MERWWFLLRNCPDHLRTMLFDPPLLEGRLVKRYKRFLADIELPSGDVITVHCPNPGAMLGLNIAGSRAWISDSQNPKRKLRYTLELLEIGGTMVGINTQMPNKLALEAIENRIIPSLAHYDRIRTEVRYGTNSRIDILLEHDGAPDIYVEVKNVHFRRAPNLHEFPDSVTDRGTKHLNDLIKEVENGNRGVMLYVIQRSDGDRFAIAEDLDPTYAKTFNRAIKMGVEMLAVTCNVTYKGIKATRLIPVVDEIGR